MPASPASPASPSRYHGDESRHRLSAVISCMLSAGIFLDPPPAPVVVCVLSAHHEAHRRPFPLFSFSYLLLTLLCPPPPGRLVSPQVTNLLLQKATATRSHYRMEVKSMSSPLPASPPSTHLGSAARPYRVYSFVVVLSYSVATRQT